MRSLFLKKPAEYGAIIDVHSGSVGIAITELDLTTKKPVLLFAHREYIQIMDKPTTENLIRGMRKALFAASLEFSQNGLGALRAHNKGASISRLLVVCGAPWAQTSTRFIRTEDTVPFVVTQSKVQGLIAEAEKKDQEEFKTTKLLEELEVSLVEHSVIHTALNGYLTSEPYGKTATEISLAHISGLIPKTVIEAVKEVEEKILTHAKRSSHTFALTLFCVLRDLYPETKNAVMIDVSGEATEICVMQDEVLLEASVVLYGTHTFLRDVALELKTIPEEALAHVRDYGEATPERIKLAVVKVSEAYVERLSQAFTELEKKYMLPRNFFLLTSKNLDGYFEKIVRQASLKYTKGHGSLLSLNSVLKEGLAPHDAFDIFFAIESKFFHKLHGCSDIV